jgi:hypothetical protein
MMDATNVGISPLMSTPMTTQYLGTTDVQTGFTTDAFAQPLTFGTGSLPVMSAAYSTTPVLDQGFVMPQATTVIPDAGLGTSFVPQTTLPDQALTSFVPDLTGAASIVPTPDVQTLPLATPPVTSVVQPPVASVVAPPVTSVVQPPVASVVAPPVTSVVQPPVASVVPSTVPSLISPPAVSSVAVPGVGLPVGGLEGSALPPITSPEIVSANPLAQTTGSYATSSTGAYATASTAGLIPPSPQQNQPVGPIMDEDFQRGRPVYDELNEDRYRGFRMGR